MALSPFPSCAEGEHITWLPLPPGVEYDKDGETIRITNSRASGLSDKDILTLRALDTDLQLAIHSDGLVDICDDTGVIIASAMTLRGAFLVAKAIYAAARYTWTRGQIERERRISFQHGVSVKPGTELDGDEMANMPVGSVVYADGYVFQRRPDKWVGQLGEVAPTPRCGTFLGIIERPFGLEPVEDGDSDLDSLLETANPYGPHPCCEHCGTDREGRDE